MAQRVKVEEQEVYDKQKKKVCGILWLWLLISSHSSLFVLLCQCVLGRSILQLFKLLWVEKWGWISCFSLRSMFFESVLACKHLFDVYRLRLAWWIFPKCQTLFSSPGPSRLKRTFKGVRRFDWVTGLEVEHSWEELESADLLRRASRLLFLSVWDILTHLQDLVDWRKKYKMSQSFLGCMFIIWCLI